MLMEYYLKGLVRHRHVVFKSWVWGCGTGGSFWDVCVENTTFGWEKKTKPCLYFFFFFLEIVLFSCRVWTIKVNNILCPSLALYSCSSLFCFLFLLLPYPLTDALSTRVTKLFHMIHMVLLTRIVEIFFISLWETYVYIIIWAEA